MTRWLLIAVCGAVAGLSGCGNAYEHIEMGEWREVGRARPPMVPAKTSFAVTTLEPGDGPVVSAGDLIKARVAVTTVDVTGSTRANPPPQDVWVWTGSVLASGGPD